MNKDRRKSLDEIRGRLEEAKATIEEIKTDLEGVQSEEQDTFDNYPEGLQASEQGQRTEQAADHLGDAASTLEEIVDTQFQAILDSIDEAVGA